VSVDLLPHVGRNRINQNHSCAADLDNLALQQFRGRIAG
jgi:hypothetical protein